MRPDSLPRTLGGRQFAGIYLRRAGYVTAGSVLLLGTYRRAYFPKQSFLFQVNNKSRATRTSSMASVIPKESLRHLLTQPVQLFLKLGKASSSRATISVNTESGTT